VRCLTLPILQTSDCFSGWHLEARISQLISASLAGIARARVMVLMPLVRDNRNYLREVLIKVARTSCIESFACNSLSGLILYIFLGGGGLVFHLSNGNTHHVPSA
jgi:hypothetical protein